MAGHYLLHLLRTHMYLLVLTCIYISHYTSLDTPKTEKCSHHNQ